MTGWYGDQLLSERERTIEYNRGLKMGLWLLKKSKILPLDFLINALEEEIKNSELEHTEMLLRFHLRDPLH